MRLLILIMPFVLSCSAVGNQQPALHHQPVDHSAQEAGDAATQAAQADQMHQHHVPPPSFP